MTINIKGSPAGTINISGTGGQVKMFTVPVFGPMSLGGLKAWYDASAITGLSDGSPVPLWNDSSGNGYTALLYMGYGGNDDSRLISPDSDSPSWVQADANFNGKPSVHFKGKGYGPYNTGHKFSSKSGSYPASGGFTMYFVGRLDPAAQDNSGERHLIAGVNAPDSAGYGTGYQYDTMPFFRYTPNNPGWGGPSTSVVSGNGNTFAAYSETLAGPGVTSILSYGIASAARPAPGSPPGGDNFGDALMYINGSNSGITQTHNSTKVLLPITDIYLGCFEARPFAGNMAEFILYEGKHSDSDRALVTAYLAAKYGITI